MNIFVNLRRLLPGVSVRDLMACRPKCFVCQFEMPSGPVNDVFFFLVLPMASLAICVGNGSVMFVLWGLTGGRRLSMRLSCLLCFRLHIDAKSYLCNFVSSYFYAYIFL